MRAAVAEAGGEDLYNLIEPRALVDQFLRHAPAGFTAFALDGAVPAFATDFDITTTTEPEQRRRLMRLPFWPFLRRCLTFRTCFIGATVSEFALLPRTETPRAFAVRLTRLAAEYPLLIVKDIPSAPELTGVAAQAYNEALADACAQAGFILVEGQALAYVPLDFASTEEFLARMPRARRKDIRRKLRSTAAVDIQTVATGAALFADEALLARLYALYRNVYAQSEIHFDLLSAEFFRAVFQDADGGGVVFLYHVAGELIGFNLCFEHAGRLLDKYVGFAYPQAREHNLYVVSWFHNLDHARARGLGCYVAGWTDPEIKRHLGASFVFTRHAVYFRNSWLRRLLKPFKHFFEADAQWRQQTR